MHPVLKLLIDLQEIDHQIELIQDEIKDQDLKIKEKEKKIEEIKDLLVSTENKEKDLIFKLKKKENDLQQIEYKIEQKKKEFYSGKFTNPKELSGFQKEMRHLEDERDKKETDIITLMEESEDIKDKLKILKEKIKKETDKIKKEIGYLKKDNKKLEEKLEKLRQKKAEISEKIDERHYRIYINIKKEKGNPIVSIKNNTCNGCHLTVPEDVINKTKESKDIVTCPNCGRILYWGESSSGGRA